MEKIYLAIPYTAFPEESFRIANEISGKLMKEGLLVFSPISHSHPISSQEGVPGSWSFWEKFDRSFIEWSDKVYIVVIGEKGEKMIENSVGVQGEIKIAKELEKPIERYYYKN